jgi:hypothetical protein
MHALAEAVLSAKRRHARTIARRNGLVATMRATARNALARRRASDPLQPLAAPYAWLSDIAAAAATPRERAAWRALQERYQVGPLLALRPGICCFLQACLRMQACDPTSQPRCAATIEAVSCTHDCSAKVSHNNRSDLVQPSVPGMVINGIFVPATNRKSSYQPPQLSGAAGSETSTNADNTSVNRRAPATAASRALAPAAAAGAVQGWAQSHDGGKYLHCMDGSAPPASLNGVATPPGAPRPATARRVALQMRQPQGRKLRRLLKWLDDAWLASHVVPATDDTRLVLPNGMILRSPATRDADRALSSRRRTQYSHPADRAERRAAQRRRWTPPPGMDVSASIAEDTRSAGVVRVIP